MLIVSQFKSPLWGRGEESWPPFLITGSPLSLSPGSPFKNTEPQNPLGHLLETDLPLNSLVDGHSDFLLTLLCLWD